MLPMLTILPIIQLVVLSFAADFEFRNLKLAVLDQDHSENSRKLISKFTSSGYFKLGGNFFSVNGAMEEMERDHADIVLVIPHGFDRALTLSQPVRVQLLVNAVNSQKAGIAANYSQQVISLVNKDLISSVPVNPALVSAKLEIRESFWYNSLLNYKTFMVPGILAILVTMLTAFLSAMNIIREKELGTMEQLNVTPLKRYEFILGKLIPYWFIGMFMLGFGLTVAYILFGITVAGSTFLLFGFCAIYLVAVLGIGMLISSITETQQQAMFLTWFFFVIFILLSGLFTPIDNIPQWAKALNMINPLQYFVELMRRIMLKGANWNEIAPFYGIMVIFAIISNSLAILSLRKTN